MFESLISKFPIPIPVDFRLREEVGQYAVEFSDGEDQYKEDWSWRGATVSFFDENAKVVAVIMPAGPVYTGSNRDEYIDRPTTDLYVDKIDSPFHGEDISGEQFMEFMLTEYPPFAEYLLWHL